ncbi:MAG: putative metal-binding motif-containing protein, partial [Deltaproteobacteria bacterium]|nr:putative metal-binding motif-containing protein [Deltaproteobacteria bacterium]
LSNNTSGPRETKVYCDGYDVDEDGYTENQGDCDDENTDINPGVPEICDDGIDNNCDGQIDEGCVSDFSLPLPLEAIDKAVGLGSDAVENMMNGDVEELKQMIRDSKDELSNALDKLGVARENDELDHLSQGEVWEAELSLSFAKRFEQLAIRELENGDNRRRRKTAKGLVKSALYFAEYARSILEQ